MDVAVTDRQELVVEMLEPAEIFVVCAARIYRALSEQTGPPSLCLCRIFNAAGIPGALQTFAFFQSVLVSDPERRFVAEDRGSRVVSVPEVQLLRAIARWQRAPWSPPEHALDFVTAAATRRIAAPAGHAFSLEMASVGLWVRSHEPVPAEPRGRHSVFSRDISKELKHVH